MADFVLIAARFVHLGAELFLFGGLLFPLYGRLDDGALRKRLAGTLEVAAALAAVSALAWLACVVVALHGDVAALLEPEAIWPILLESEFGRLWSAHFFLSMLLVTTLVGLTAPPFSGFWAGWCVLLAGALLATQALTGHVAAEGGLPHALLDAVHLLAAGVWLGGLPPLLMALRHGERAQLAQLLCRFSRVALPAVLLLALSGAVNASRLGVSATALFQGIDAYALLLGGKTALFGLLLGLAMLNRYRLLPRLADAAGERAVRLLRASVRLELLLLVAVLGLVSWLGTLAPPMIPG